MDDRQFDALARSVGGARSRRSVLATIAGGLAALAGPNLAAAKRPKVQLCHKGKTKSVAESAVNAHLRQGDTLGPCCPSGKTCQEYEGPGTYCCPNATDACVTYDEETLTIGGRCPAHRETCFSGDDTPSPVCCATGVPCADNGRCCPSGKSCMSVGGISALCCPNATDVCVDWDGVASDWYGDCCPPGQMCTNPETGRSTCCA